MKMKKVLVALSGGVDSSTTAYLLKEQGYECDGATMLLCNNKESDVLDAEDIARSIGIGFTKLDCRNAFSEYVINDFIKSYESGLTPNPCVQCNKFLKFGKFLEYALTRGYDYIATGHYAQIIFDESLGRFLLKKAANPIKDQSYFLYSLTQNQLSHTLFPLGNFDKDTVRNMAEGFGIANARKKDSQDICFVPNGKYVDFIEKFTGNIHPKGNFLDPYGNIIGTHAGAIHYTYGQRKGLGLSLPQPGYVYKKDMKANTVYVGNEDLLFSDNMTVNSINWIMWENPPADFDCLVKTRSRQNPVPAHVMIADDGSANVRFNTPLRAITPGQSAVFYLKDLVLGGGIITEDCHD